MKTSAANASLSIVTDRVTGLLGLLLLGLACVAIYPQTMRGQEGLAAFVAICVVVLMVISFGLVSGHGMRLAAKGASVVGRTLRGPVTPDVSGQLALTAFPSILVMCLAAQSFALLQGYLLCLALGINITIWQITWVAALGGVAQALPISIAGLGIREGTYVFFLHYQGVDAASAIAVALLIFAT